MEDPDVALGSDYPAAAGQVLGADGVLEAVGGEKLACTPGAVVYRDEIFELLQYAPATPTVRGHPLLMVPPELNRYFVLDLAPGRSMVEYAVALAFRFS